jgi:hypothetical protein
MQIAQSPQIRWKRWIFIAAIIGSSLLLMCLSAVVVVFVVLARILYAMVVFIPTLTIQTNDNLYCGESPNRLVILSQFKQAFDQQPEMKLSPEISAWLVPAIDQCRNDCDPEVALIAGELVRVIEERSQPPP